MAEGLLVIRCALGLLLFAHGAQKLFGWWGGHGLDGTGGFFAQVGHRPGRVMATIAGVSEAAGGGLLVLGLFTPLGAAMVMGVMIVAAASVHAQNGLWATNGGFELPLTNGLVALGLAFTGAGSWSVDGAAGIPATSGWWAGIGALLLAGVTSALALLRRQHVLTTDEPATAYPSEAVPADPSAADAGEVSARTAAGEGR
jgi:putative oxidoreductase